MKKDIEIRTEVGAHGDAPNKNMIIIGKSEEEKRRDAIADELKKLNEKSHLNLEERIRRLELLLNIDYEFGN